jgi:hypothetical protein
MISSLEKSRRQIPQWQGRKRSLFPGVCYSGRSKDGYWVARIGHNGDTKEASFPHTRRGEIQAAMQYLTWLSEKCIDE